MDHGEDAEGKPYRCLIDNKVGGYVHVYRYMMCWDILVTEYNKALVCSCIRVD